ncbi:MAG TPA: alpha/beta fold hydrolase [Acidimicrobiales bacterium]|nr:alpha/beta fold hydrolase [Acidimicrobiales bacterium]
MPRRRQNRALALGAAGVGAGLAATAAFQAARRHRNRALDLAELRLPNALTHHHVTVDDGAVIHTVENGHGRPLVLLHGVTLSIETWPYQIATLSKHFRVIALDQRGHGRSQRGSGGYGIARMASDAAQVLTHLDISDAVVVGHSMGGMVTQQMCLDFPDLARQRVAGTILLSTAAAVSPGIPGLSAVNRVANPGVLTRATGRGFPAGDVGYALARLAVGTNADPRHVAHTRNMTAAVPPATLAALMPGVIGFDIRSRLKDYPVPALVITGSRDLLTPPRLGRDIARRIPGAEFEVVSGAGHMLMMERAEWLNDRIAAFARDH